MIRLLLVLHALLVVSTPAIVVAVVAAAARAAGGTAPGWRSSSPRKRLGLGTLLVGAVFVVWLIADPRAAGDGPARASFGLAEIAAFCLLGLGLGLPALGEVMEAVRKGPRAAPGDASSGVRHANLAPRRVSDVLPWPLQTVAPLLSCASAIWVAVAALEPTTADRRLFLPVAFAFVALVFSGLFAAWIHEEACGPRPTGPSAASASPEDERRRTVLHIFAAQVGLAATFSVLAILLVSLDWASSNAPQTAIATSVVGGLIGVLGCGYALSSAVGRRALEVEGREILS